MQIMTSNANHQFQQSEVALQNGTNHWASTIKVYPAHTRQSIIGFGGAFTEAAGYTLSQMDKDKQQELYDLYFGENGNRYNFCRTHIQSCDFALGNYTYVDDPNDKDLKSFSIERDHKYIIPLIQEALKRNPDIEFLASPWSPPAFMKTNQEMNHGGALKPEFYGMWADMMARYITEYKKLGIIIKRISVQNEPEATQTWDSCRYTGQEEAVFACEYLRKSLDAAGHTDVKINVWDHNKEVLIERIEATMAHEQANEAIDGIAFHWYSGDHFESLGAVHESYPDKELIFTEGCVEYSRFKNDAHVQNAEMYAHDLIGNFKNGMNGYIDWNLYLNEEGGPNHVKNFCDAPVMCDTQNQVYEARLSYTYIGHFSRFVKKGAKRIIVSTPSTKLEAVGFVNPDGEKVLVVLNRTDKNIAFAITEGSNIIDTQLEAHSIMTATWA